jgi:hypothetical protein
MKSLKKACFTAICLLLSNHVLAENDPKTYAEIGYSLISYKEPGFTASPTAIRGIIGYEISPNLAAEAMLGFGAADSTQTIQGLNVAFSIGTMSGVYLKPKIALSDDFEIFGRFGYAKSGAEASVVGYTLTSSGDDFSYGGGAKFRLTQNTDAVIDYMSYYDKNSVTAKGFTFGLGFKF